MKFIRPRRSSGLTGINGFVAAVSIATALAGCTSPSLTNVKMAPNSVAKKLGLSGCRVSVPLSQSEIVADAKTIGNPRPEGDREWIAIVKSAQSDDQLRAVDCLKAKRSTKGSGTYFYALIRDNQIIKKFYVGIFD